MLVIIKVCPAVLWIMFLFNVMLNINVSAHGRSSMGRWVQRFTFYLLLGWP